MPRRKSIVHLLLDEVQNQAVTSVLQPAGFHQTGGRNYHRRLGETVQVVNVQFNCFSTWNEKRFIVNVGIAFDAICALIGLPIVETPKADECGDRGTDACLHQLFPGVPHEWTIHPERSVGGLVRRLRRSIERLRTNLDLIDGPRAYYSHRWFNRARPRGENALLFYLMGDFDRARHEVRDLAAVFAHCRTGSTPEWWIDQLGLTKLKKRKCRVGLRSAHGGNLGVLRD